MAPAPPTPLFRNLAQGAPSLSGSISTRPFFLASVVTLATLVSPFLSGLVPSGLALGGQALSGQALSGQTPDSPVRVRVFLDCQSRNCNASEFRTEVTFVDWVREREASNIHLIMTSQSAGAGTEYVFDFLGSGPFLGMDAEVRYTSPSTDTQDETLGGLTRTLAAGLAGYAARLGYGASLEITPLPSPTASPAVPATDPWNLWVFELGANFEMRGEERESSQEFGGSFSANRTTPDWRIEFEVDGEFSERRVELNDGREFVRAQDEWEVESLVVRSLAPHWSGGAEVGANTSTRFNRDLGFRAGAALEWSYFPYPEANRRQFVVQYQLGVAQIRYEDETIFGKLEETLADQRLAAVYELRQPWGDASFTAGWSNYLHDWDRFALAVGADFGIRLFRGLELNVQGEYDIIRNQLYLPAEDLSDEEILVQQRALATGYEYSVDVGIRYRFGSVYNNVVNNRFPWVVRRF